MTLDVALVLLALASALLPPSPSPLRQLLPLPRHQDSPGV